MGNASGLRLFLQQRRNECFKHIDKVMYESCPELGDMGTREDFIRVCSAMRRQSQGTRLNEGYELRVSWSPEELSRDSPDDIRFTFRAGQEIRA